MKYNNSPDGATYSMNVDGHNTKRAGEAEQRDFQRLFQPIEDGGADQHDQRNQYGYDQAADGGASECRLRDLTNAFISTQMYY